MSSRELLYYGEILLREEAASLDEQRWDDWIDLFTTNCEYWVPTWRTEEELTDDPKKEMSLIYYSDRGGLEDRILRIRSRRSAASMPLVRTAHTVSNVQIKDGSEKTMTLRATWTCHLFNPHTLRTAILFGHARYVLCLIDGAWRISRKKTILQSDYIATMIDVNCI